MSFWLSFELSENNIYLVQMITPLNVLQAAKAGPSLRTTFPSNQMIQQIYHHIPKTKKGIQYHQTKLSVTKEHESSIVSLICSYIQT